MAHGGVRYVVPPEGEGAALAEWLASADGPDAADVVARGGAWVAGRRVRDPGLRLAAGDEVVVHRQPEGAPSGAAIGPERILYEDEDLIAVDKPGGTYVESTPWDADDHLRGAIARMLEARDGAAPQLHLAHRLDRDTTGVLLLTRRPQANRAVHATFVEGRVRKRYLALLAGDPAFGELLVETGHGRGARGRFQTYPLAEVGRELPDGSRVKLMRTRFEVLRRYGAAALALAAPETGRTHQIRLHAAELGHPLVGDVKYGGPSEWRGEALPGHLLHAERLALPHPRTGAELVIVAPAPPWASG